MYCTCSPYCTIYCKGNYNYLYTISANRTVANRTNIKVFTLMLGGPEFQIFFVIVVYCCGAHAHTKGDSYVIKKQTQSY